MLSIYYEIYYIILYWCKSSIISLLCDTIKGIGIYRSAVIRIFCTHKWKEVSLLLGDVGLTNILKTCKELKNND